MGRSAGQAPGHGACSRLRPQGETPCTPSGGYPAPGRRGFSRPRPAVPRRAQKGPFPGYPRRTPKMAILGLFCPKSRFLRILSSRAPEGPPGRPGYRGAPARGVDVKPPLARAPGGVPGASQAPGRSRTLPGSRRALPGSPGGGGPPSRGLRARGFTSTPRAGSPRFPAGPGQGSRAQGPGDRGSQGRGNARPGEGWYRTACAGRGVRRMRIR